MGGCSIRWCGKNSQRSNYKTDGITFHRFPKEPGLKKKWIASTKRENWIPSNYSVVCSRHFTEDCFNIKNTRRRLFDTAMPTLFMPVVVSSTKDTDSTEVVASTSRQCISTQPKDLPEDAKLNSDDDITDSDIDEEPRHRARAAEASQEVPHASDAEHGSDGCICKFCQREIIGFHYTCMQCEDVVLCSECEAKDRHYLHYVLRIPESRPQEEVKRVLCRIRHVIKEGLLPFTAKDTDDCNKADNIDKADDNDKATNTDKANDDAHSFKVEVKEEPDPGPDPLQDPLNTAFDQSELRSELDIKIEEEWLFEEMKQENRGVFTHTTAEAGRDKMPQKRPSQNITTVPEKKLHFTIETNTPSCSGSEVNIDKNLKVITITPLLLNESSNFEVYTHTSKDQTNEGTQPQASEEGSSVKKKNN